MIRIIMVAPTPPPYGGIANWSRLLKEYINKRDDIVIVDSINIAPKSRDLDGRSIFERVVVQGFKMLGMAKQLKKSIKKNPHSIVHMTTSGQFGIVRDIKFLKICRKKRIHSVYHIRFGRVSDISEKNTLEWKLLKKAINLSNVVVSIDETTNAVLKKYFPDKAVKIPNPFDSSAIKQLDNKETVKEIMFLGWCIKAKGIEELLDAWSSLSLEYTQWKLRIVGPYQEKYLAELKERFSCEGVIFDGEKGHDEALELLQQASIFILPSYTEGFPNVVLEAMALSKPIIATDVGAIKEMLSENSGILIEPMDVEAIKNALKKLIDNEELRNILSDNAYKRAYNNYEIENVIEEYKAVWEKN